MMTKEERREYNRQWRLSHRELVLKHRKTYREQNKVHIRKWCLKTKYGITPERYDEMLVEQNGRCAICFVPQADYPKKFHVDHDHGTKQVRGLLCSKCNNAIGLLKEDVEILNRAREYLFKYKYAKTPSKSFRLFVFIFSQWNCSAVGYKKE